MGRSHLLAAVLVLLAVIGTTVWADRIVVTTTNDENNSGGFCSLREAIRASSFGASGTGCDVISDSAQKTTIELNHDLGTFFLTITGTEDSAVSGDLDINTDTIIRSTNGQAVIDAVSRFPIFEIHGGSLELHGVELRNGLADVGENPTAGAVLSHISTPLTIEDCIFRSNVALTEPLKKRGAVAVSSAGAVFSPGVITITNSEFYNNIVNTNSLNVCSGAVLSYAGMLVRDTVFVDNRCRDLNTGGAPDSCGGAIAIDGDAGSFSNAVLEIFTSSFRGNFGFDGGAILAVSASVVATDTEFVNNNAIRSGGAVNADGDVRIIGEMTTPLLSGNVASGGFGGVVRSRSSVEITNVAALSDNYARGSGGVAWAQYDVHIANVDGDISRNFAGDSGGVVYAQLGEVEIDTVGGDINFNEASVHGGVVYAGADRAVIQSVGGIIEFNKAFSFGGVICSNGPNGDTIIQGVGAIEHNDALRGGVIYVNDLASGNRGNVIVDDVGGDIHGNRATDTGGVVHAFTGGETEVFITNVVGSVSGNTAEYVAGGVVYTNARDVSVMYIGGAIAANDGVLGGVVYQVADLQANTEIAYVGQGISRNAAETMGGVVYSRSSHAEGREGTVSIHDITGDIRDNVLRRSYYTYVGTYSPYNPLSAPFLSPGLIGGGVVSTDGDVVLHTVSGGLVANLAGAAGFGGVVYAGKTCEIRDVYGSVNRNTGIGSVVFAYSVDVTNIGGAISYNSTPTFAAEFEFGDTTIDGVGGGIVANTQLSLPDYFGVLVSHFSYVRSGIASGRRVTVRNVEGNISFNTCRYGCVASAYESVLIENAGNISNNIATASGGVAYSLRGTVSISNVGDIVQNFAQSSGGAVAAENSVTVSTVGKISQNASNSRGGVVWSRLGSIEVEDCGAIEYNNASEGGALYTAQGTLRVARVGGNISYNTCEFDGGFAYVGGSFTVVDVVDVDGNISNNSGTSGGFLYAYSSGVLLSRVQGDISFNAATSGDGGVVSVALGTGTVTISYVGGSIVGNSSEDDGGVVSGEVVSIEHITGSISRNTAVDDGGVVRAGSGVSIEHIGGALEYNYAVDGAGGIAHARTAQISVLDIGGNIEGNFAGQYGGAFSAEYSSISISDVRGDLISNSAGYFGGVAGEVYGSISVDGVYGDISRNSAAYNGGAFAAPERVEVRGVYGSIEGNYALSGSGGFAVGSSVVPLFSTTSTTGAVFVENVTGSIRYNRAGYSGGFALSYQVAQVSDIGGDVTYNYAAYSGGVVSSVNGALLTDVSGDVAYNSAYYDGGVLFAEVSAARLERIGGSVNDNSSTGGGGGVLRGETAIIENIGGSVSRNRSYFSGGVARGLYAARIENVDGSIEFNSTGVSGGGVLHSFGPGDILNVAGSVSFNHAGSSGGVCRGEQCTIAVIGGNVSGNFSYRSGGVLKCDLNCAIRQVSGNVSDNRSDNYFGGVMFAYDYGIIEQVGGSVERNSALLSGGVIAVSRGEVVLRSIGGNVSYNTARNGGVGYTGVDCYNDSDGAHGLIVTNIGGAVSYNKATLGDGGVLYSERCGSDRGELSYIGGGIHWNSCYYYNCQGGVVVAPTVSIHSVTGNIAYNSADGTDSSGGVAAANDITVESIDGSIWYNSAYRFGGAFYQPSSSATFILRVISGDLSYNTAGVGGFVYTEADAITISSVANIEGNSATYGDGGFAYGSATFASVRDVASIRRNLAAYSGGFFYASSSSIVISDVHGDVSYNSALYSGGVVVATGVLLERVNGSIESNSATQFSGGVVYAEDSCVVRNVEGSITGNSSGRSGGALYSGAALVVEDIEGDVSDNATYVHGGALYGDSVSLNRIKGSVCGNSAQGSGGAIYGATEVIVQDISGSICRNRATSYGGAIGSGSNVRVSIVGGSIRDNNAYYGGAMYCDGQLAVQVVSGDVSDNVAVVGGAFASTEQMSVSDIGGSITGNISEERGGVIYAGEDVFLVNVDGGVSGNFAGGHGGVMYSSQAGVINNIHGSLSDNNASYGGVLYAENRGVISRIRGDIARNIAFDGYGGVLYSAVECEIEDVDGSIVDNEGEYGGVVFSGDNAIVRVVSGDVSRNSATYGDGGVIYGLQVELVDVAGRICSNSAERNGGVVYASSGEATVANAGNGPIQNNSALSGGVCYSQSSSCFVEAGDGIIVNNTPEVAVAGNLVDVQGSIVFSGTTTITVVQDPGNGIENTPLDPQPEIIVSGAEPDHELPIQVVLVREDLTERVLEGPFKAVFGSTIRFLDIAIPEVGAQFSLRFELAAISCTDTLEVLGSGNSGNFSVTDCISPSPVVCADDIVIETKPHECSAFVNVPLPLSSRCSDPIITHSITPAISSSAAAGNYAAGDTFVTYTVESQAGESDTCQVKVTVLDTEAPVLTCAPAIVASSDVGQCGAVVAIPPPTVADNCDPLNVLVSASPSSSFFPVGETTVKFTGVDDHGNAGSCTTTVTVIDVEAPVITCPQDVVVGCDALPTFHEPRGTDNCPGAVTTQHRGPALGTDVPLAPGATTFEFVVVDAQGERATCSFTATTEGQWHLDADGDGVGQAGEPIVQCPAPGPNYVADSNSDCDDTNPNISVLLFPDVDEDGFGNSQLPFCSPPDTVSKRSVSEVALVRLGGDCNDNDPLINPNQRELCNGVDDNCNGLIDEGCVSPETPPSTPTLSLVPDAPLAPEASRATIFVIPTPLPQPPSSPETLLIIVQPNISSGAAQLVGMLSVALCGVFMAFVM